MLQLGYSLRLRLRVCVDLLSDIGQYFHVSALHLNKSSYLQAGIEVCMIKNKLLKWYRLELLLEWLISTDTFILFKQRIHKGQCITIKSRKSLPQLFHDIDMSLREREISTSLVPLQRSHFFILVFLIFQQYNLHHNCCSSLQLFCILQCETLNHHITLPLINISSLRFRRS